MTGFRSDAKTAVAKAIRESGDPRSRLLAEADDTREATWRERALNAEDALKAAHAEILAQRNRIGELLGRIRDLEAEWTQDDVQRITAENTTLKQRVRQLSTDNPQFHTATVTNSWVSHTTNSTPSTTTRSSAPTPTSQTCSCATDSPARIPTGTRLRTWHRRLITYGKYHTLDLSALSYERIANNQPLLERAVI